MSTRHQTPTGRTGRRGSSRLRVPAAALVRAAGGHGVRLPLELVGQRLELDLPGGRVGERVGEQAVGEPRVAGQQRAVEVRAVDPAGATALVTGLAVVAEARDHAPERLGAVVQVRAAGVVLEAGERAALAGPGAVEQDVADHAALAGDRAEREQADPRQLSTGAVAVEAAEQLVAAAHGEKRGAAGNRIVESGPLGHEVGRDEPLLAILPAA